MNKKIWIGIIALVVIIGGFFIWNTSKNQDTSDVTISYVGDNIEAQFNPQKQEGYDNLLVNLSANLAIFDKDGKTQPYAAQSIDMSSDNKSVSIKLKDGLAFENGEKITAKNYLEGIKLLSNPKTKASYQSWATDNIVGAKNYAENKDKTIKGFEIKNDLEFKINLIKPIRYFKDMLVAINFAPVSPDYLNKVGIENYGKDEKNYLSSGPLKVKGYQKSQYLKYELNDKSVLSKNTPVKTLTVKFINSESAQVQMFKNKQLDTILKSDSVDKILGYDKTKTADSIQETPYMTYLTTNSKTVSKNIANALNLSLDKDIINKNFLSGIHKIRSVITPNNYKNLDEELNKIGIDPNKNEYDINKAKDLVKNEDKKTYIGLYDESIKQDVIKYIISQAEQVGIKIKFEKYTSALLSKEVYKPIGTRKYDFAIKSWGQDYSNPASFLDSLLSSKSNVNFANYENNEVDSLLNAAINSKTDEQESQNYAKIIKIVKDNSIIIPLYQRVKPYYIKDSGYNTDIIGRLGVINNWVKK